MSDELTACLDRLEAAMDLGWEREKIAAWKRFLSFETGDGPFATAGAVEPQEPPDWPAVTVNEAIGSPEKMLLQQLAGVYHAALARSFLVPNIRCNYGTAIMPSLFGARMFWMDEELNTLPTSWPLEGEDAMDKLLERGVPDLDAGFGRQVFETAQYFREQLAPYPKLTEAVWIYHPDLQGPIDVVELLWGSDLFLALVDVPGKVQAVAEVVTDTYIAFLTRWFDEVPPPPLDPEAVDGQYMAHWSHYYKGRVMLRNDSIVNLSPDMYGEFVKPPDERVLETFGGGAIHFCGRGSHVIDSMTDSEWLRAVQMSQPHLNDMDAIYDATVGRGKVLNCGTVEHIQHRDLSRGVVGN
jgi:hypothetical protein